MAFVPVEITEEKLAALDDEHDGVVRIQGPEEAPYLFVLRRPTGKELRAYNAMKDGLEANHKFIAAVCVYPSRPDVERQLERWPAVAGTILNKSERWQAFSGMALAAHQK